VGGNQGCMCGYEVEEAYERIGGPAGARDSLRLLVYEMDECMVCSTCALQVGLGNFFVSHNKAQAQGESKFCSLQLLCRIIAAHRSSAFIAAGILASHHVRHEPTTMEVVLPVRNRNLGVCDRC